MQWVFSGQSLQNNLTQVNNHLIFQANQKQYFIYLFIYFAFIYFFFPKKMGGGTIRKWETKANFFRG